MPDDWVSDDHSVMISPRREGAKRFRDEMSKTGGEKVVARRPGSRLPLLHPGSVVSRRRSEGHLWRSRPGCTGPVQRNTRSRGGGSVSSALHTYPGLMSVSPEMFPALLSVSSAGPVSQAARGSVSPRPPAPAAPNAARTCPHLHTKVDTNLPFKQVTVKQC